METSYFGPITLSAVKAFQVAKGWTPANQVGPLTRAELNALINATPAIPGTPVVPTVGCPAGAIYNSVTGALCSVVAPTPGATGFLSIPSLSPSPASNANIIETSNVPVLGVNIKAIGSNMTVSSAKLKIAVSEGDYPSVVVQNLHVYDGSTLLGSYPVNVSTVIKDGSYYYVILSGFNFVIPANTTKTLTINADFNSGLETSRTVTFNLYGTDAVRGTDSMGAFTTAYLATTRAYTVTYTTVGSSTLTATASTSTPASTSVNVDATNGTTDVPVLVFNAKSTVGASQITDLVFTVTAIDTAMFADVTAIKLYDGSTLLGSVSPVESGSTGAGTATFSDLAIDVAKDATKALTVKADIAAGVTAEDTLIVSITPTSQITYRKPDLSSRYGYGSAITGKTMYVFNGEAAAFTLVGATATYTYNSTTPSASYTSGVITLKVKANGGTITPKLDSDDFTVNAYLNGSLVGAAASKSVTITPDDVVSDGTESTVVINVSESREASGTGFVSFEVDNIAWVISDGTTTVTVTGQNWGLDTFKTPAVSAQ